MISRARLEYHESNPRLQVLEIALRPGHFGKGESPVFESQLHPKATYVGI